MIVDATYEGGTVGTFADDPLAKLLPCGNQGGFRYKKDGDGNYLFVILYSTLAEPDWPDNLDENTGIFTYYGDNREPGHELHDTVREGNRILRDAFADTQTEEGRRNVPPFLVFTKGTKGRDVVFRGLAVPGAEGIRPIYHLVAIWKNKEGERFQNYEATFTILDVPKMTRLYLDDILKGNPFSENAPKAWIDWVKKRRYDALASEPIRIHRTRNEQLPELSSESWKILQRVYGQYKKNPFDFEVFAANPVQLMDNRIIDIDVTRPYRVGGREAK